MFLIAVVGMCRPLLFPFLPEILRRYPFLRLGGFQDGSRSVAEPLARPCIMTLDSTGERESELAQLLYSSRKAIVRIQLYVFLN